MATKTLLKRGNFRIQFRIKDLKLISRTFPTEREADAYQARIENEITNIQEAEKARLPVDMAALYAMLHPDLQEAVQLWPVFAQVLGLIAANQLSLSKLTDELAFQYQKKDKNIL